MDLAYLPQTPLSEFVERRQKVLAQMQDNSVAVLFSAREEIRNNDCTFPFRQESNFWYLTGFNECESILLLRKQKGEKQSILFLRPKDPLMETWHGRRLGVEQAPSELKVDQAFNIEEFKQLFPQLIENIKCFYIKFNPQAGSEELVKFCVEKASFAQHIDLSLILDEMRLFKSPNEIALMQQAGQISALGHIRAMEQTRPNRMEYEIASEMVYEFNRHGARYEAYASIVAGGDNACILHYSENDHLLKDGDLLLIDAGCEFAMYAGDISRTFPVNGKFSEAQADIYNLVLKVQKYAIANLVPNATIQEVSDEVIHQMVKGLVELGIMQGEVHELIASQAYRQFYMHSLGHWLGLDVHDVGSYSKDGTSNDRNKTNRNRPLQAGMVLTVEPGIYIAKNASVPEEYRGIGVRIEDDVLITATGNKVLTSAVPKEIDQIEQLMAKARERS